MKNSIVLFFLCFTITLVHAQEKCGIRYATVRADTFKLLIDSTTSVVIDLRTPEEFKKGHIKGAINMDYNSADFEQQIEKLNKQKAYYIYCENEERSGKAAVYMKAQGFCNILVLRDGFHSWKKMGYEVVKE
jgi:rhodanese-related sulfurtransferase